MTPLMKMHTLGHDFIPDPIHAGGLRYHGMSPLISPLYELGLIEAVAMPQQRVLRRRRAVRADRGHRPGARAHPRARRLHPGGAALQGDRRGEGDPHRAVRPRPPRPAGVRRYLAGEMVDHELSTDRLDASLAELPQVAATP